MTPFFRILPPSALLLAAVTWLVGACSFHYSTAQGLELQRRWEEAAIEYHLAYLDDPEDPDKLEALERVNKVVARENFELYKAYLAEKDFQKAYHRLLDASRQDPSFEPIRREQAKWLRVLVAGQVKFNFPTVQSNLSLADEIKLIVRINTPNPGEVIEAEVNLDGGAFFVENLLYDRPPQLLTYYSLNAIGVSLLFGRNRTRSFTSRDFQSFVTFRKPVLEKVEGTLRAARNGRLKLVAGHRNSIGPDGPAAQAEPPTSNPHYSLRIEGSRIVVVTDNGRGAFTPKHLYLNLPDRRLFVDFGGYEAKLEAASRTWMLRRLSNEGEDYFPAIARNIALYPYFFYRGGVFTYVAQSGG